MTERQTFTKAFKAEAVRLLEHSGKPAADLARELGNIGVRVLFSGKSVASHQ